MQKQTRLTFGIISLTTIVAILIACWKLNQPGLYYDELLFVNGATGGHADIFINYRFMGIPVFLMDYIGALKAWIYYPIFSIFGVNTWSVRLPAILIGTAGALMLTAALWRAFGPKAALAGAIFILLDPTIVIHSRLDWGPNALMFFFRGLLVLAVVNWSRTLSVRWACIAVIAICLGLFDKLNFIWMTCATMASVVLIYFDKLKTFTREHKVKAWVLAGIAGGATGLAILKGVSVAEHLNIGWGNRILLAFNVIRATIPGSEVLTFISGNGARVENTFWLGYLLALLPGTWSFRKFIKDAEQKRLFIWMATLIALVGLAFMFTKTATGPHHASMLCGLWQMLLAPLVAKAWNKLNPKVTAGKILYASSLASVAVGNLIVIVTCIKAFAKPVNINWDPVNWQAAQLAKEFQDANFICTDWGMGTLLIGLSRQHTNIYDRWSSFTNKEEAINVIKSIDPEKDTYIYTTLPGFENFKGNRDNLLKALQVAGFKPLVYKTYSNWTGKPIIEVLRVPASQRELTPKTPLKDFSINAEDTNITAAGLYGPEKSEHGVFRWTNGNGQLELPNLYAGHDTITVSMLCYSPNDEHPQISLNRNITPLKTETIQGGFRYQFIVPRGTVIYKASILSNSIVPHNKDSDNADRRQLGLLFTSLSFEE